MLTSDRPGFPIRLTQGVINRIKRVGWVKFLYNNNTNMVEVQVIGSAEVMITQDLAEILGFNQDRFPLKSGYIPSPALPEVPVRKHTFIANHPADVDRGRHMMLMYCDVLESVAVGDTLAPLLRKVDINGGFGTTIHRNYDQPRYLPIQKLNFESLEIHIKDGYGHPMPFESGTLIVTLHFRRVNTQYLLQ